MTSNTILSSLSTHASDNGDEASTNLRLLDTWKRAGAISAASQTPHATTVVLHAPMGGTLLAVDRFATRSLCFRVDGEQLLASPRADDLPGAKVIDPQAIFDYLFFHCIPSPRTIFKGVHRLPPGHCATFADGKLTVEPYWIPTFSEPQGAVSFDALKAEFRRLLRDAVASRLDGGPPACFLSSATYSGIQKP